MARKAKDIAQPFVGVLTEQDFSILRQVIHEFRSKRINTPLHSQEQYDHQAPETYVAVALHDIPAVIDSVSSTGTGSGTVAEGDVAGKGNCRLFRIMGSDDTLDRLPVTVQAFNISGTFIASGQLIILSRDKFGKWLILNGGGALIVRGRATSIVPAAGSPLTGTTFTFRKLIMDDPSITPKKLKEEPIDTPAVNRWTLVSGGVDSLVLCGFFYGAWELIEIQQVCP